jgi:hypothetical protein
VGAGFGAATFVIWMLGTWTEDLFSMAHWKWWGIGTATGCYGLLATLCLAGVEPEDKTGRPLILLARGAGVLAAVAAWLVCVWAIWFNIQSESGVLVIITSIAVVVGHANLSLLAPLTRSQSRIRLATIAGVVVAALCLDAVSVMGWNRRDAEPLIRLGSAGALLAGCGSLALAIFARMNRRISEGKPALSAIAEYTLICPGCRSKHTLRVGEAACPSCRLRFTMEIAEPRCPNCDYSLFMLESSRCPECGAPVDDQMILGLTVPAAE